MTISLVYRLLIVCVLAGIITRPIHAQGTSLADGRLQTFDDVSEWANLALDVAAIHEAGLASDETRMRMIYASGQNASYVDSQGATKFRTLQSLSLDHIDEMKKDAMFGLFVHYFDVYGKDEEGESNGYFDGKPAEQYANTLVDDLLGTVNKHKTVPYAIISLPVWMFIVHQLNDIPRACKRRDETSDDDMKQAFDIAAALWIGAGQEAGDSDSGYMLYNLAQRAGDEFGQTSNGEAEANKKVLNALEVIKLIIESGDCDVNQEGAYLDLRFEIRRLIGYMTIPLVQMLIHYVMKDASLESSDFIELFALAIAPRVRACKPSEILTMEDLLINFDFQDNEEDNAIELLQSLYSCFEVDCAMIGSYRTGVVKACQEKGILAVSYAGYPQTFDARNASRIDRDILQIRILTSMDYKESALEIYQYGYNSVTTDDTFLSLRDLATAPDRNVTSQFNLFSDYYGSPYYADVEIMQMFNDEYKFVGASPAQKTELIGGMLTNTVMYLAVLQKAFAALNACSQGDVDPAVLLFDQAVAFYVGSIEGEQQGGLADGQLMYGLGKQLCAQFDICTQDGNAAVNVAMMEFFSEVSDHLDKQQCKQMNDVLKEDVSSALLVPLIQGTLHNTVVLSKSAEDVARGAAHSFAFSILPLVRNSNEESARIIEENLQFSLTDPPVQDGADDVFRAIQNAIRSMTTPPLDSRCDDIGRYNETTYVDVCDGVDPNVSTDAPSPSEAESPTLSQPSEPDGNPVFLGSPAYTDSPAMMSLGLKGFNFVNDVTGVADIALDVRDMQNASIEQANRTYFEGIHARDQDGGRVVSLASISQTAALDMDQDPMFNIYRWALLNESVYDKKIGDNDFDPLESAYADVIVTKALEVAEDSNLAAESAVVMSIWMEISHEINNAIEYCAESDSKQSILAVDRAVALWIGTGVSEESDGYLMYNIAQQAEKNFGTSDEEARVNTEIIESFKRFQILARNCTEDDATVFLAMKLGAAELYKLMSIPLLQHLLYSVNEGLENEMKLYALAVIPQAIGCGASDFIELRDVLLSDDPFNQTNINDDFYNSIKRFQNCLRISCSDLKGNSNPSGTLATLIGNQCDDVGPSGTTLAGFHADNDVYEISRIDLDILHINIFMETNAIEAAQDYYQYGFNCRGNGKPLSLQSLATSTELNLIPQYEVFSEYFIDSNYADSFVLDAIYSKGKLAGANRDQAAEATFRALQSLVLYMAVLEKFYVAIGLCYKGMDGSQPWEEGVALFVGSLEGKDSGGNGAWDGTTLFSLGKETCDAFGTCKDNGNAKANEDIMSALRDGRDLLSEDDCENARLEIEDGILGKLPVSLIQGTLFYATENGVLFDTEEYSFASGFVLARSLLPLVDAVNKTSSQTISRNMAFDQRSSPVPDGVNAVYQAFTFVMTGMGVSCLDVGNHSGHDLCDPAVRPISDTPTNLGDTLYTTTTYVDDRAKIALDLKQIRDALNDNDKDLAQVVYRDGMNSKVYDDDGIEIGVRSLQKFSTVDTAEMTHEPIFNIFQHSLQDAKGQYLGRDVRFYGDSIVNEAFANYKDDKSLAADAILAINLWMFMIHQLFETLSNCKKKTIADTDGVHSIDEAVAYWIGDAQIVGSGEQGHLFYALAERMGAEFNIVENGQSRTNINILRLFNQAKLELSLPDACSTNPETYPRLRQIVEGILALMTVPLMQSLIHTLRVNDPPRVKLYAQAVAPLTAACNPDLFSFLREKLFDGTYNVIEVDDIIGRLRSSFECLGFTCDDIGQHVSETDNVCVPIPRKTPFAGFVPNTDVREYAQLDLDILEAGILMDMEAYDAVEDIYSFGKHSLVQGIDGPKMLSLAHLATTSDRSVVPSFDSFVRYFGDNKYADAIIRMALDPNKGPNASKEQRKEIVIKSMQFLVIYMGVMQALYDALAGCESDDASRMIGAHEDWDRAAALLIGSIEGSNDGGNKNGQFLYGLAKVRCGEFDTCGSEGFSEVNEELISLLYTGRGEVEASSCGSLMRTVNSIEALALVPLIQSTLKFAVENDKHDAQKEPGFAAGYVFSQSVMPLVDSANRDSAIIVDRNMDFQFDRKPVIDGPLAVFDAFAKVYTTLSVDCEKIGTMDGIDSCTGVQAQSAESPSAAAFAGVIIGVLAVIGVGIFIVYHRRKKREDEQEQAPIFQRSSKGVMNHDSDLLVGDASVVDGDEAFVRPLQVEAESMSMA